MDKENKTYLAGGLIALVGGILLALGLIYGVESSNEIYEQRKKEQEMMKSLPDSVFKKDLSGLCVAEIKTKSTADALTLLMNEEEKVGRQVNFETKKYLSHLKNEVTEPVYLTILDSLNKRNTEFYSKLKKEFNLKLDSIVKLDH